jgi:hypothetical protein
MPHVPSKGREVFSVLDHDSWCEKHDEVQGVDCTFVICDGYALGAGNYSVFGNVREAAPREVYAKHTASQCFGFYRRLPPFTTCLRARLQAKHRYQTTDAWPEQGSGTGTSIAEVA